MKRSHYFLILSLISSLSLVFSITIVKQFKPFFPYISYLLGQENPTSYLVLLGNDTEMRANGGFVGSYAKLILNYPQMSLSFQDIYVPNGQLKGYVTPPTPIQEAFQHGTWQLANADWEPDFPTSANTLRWFFEKGNEINPDNLVLLNLSTIKKVLDITGSFKVSEFEADITPDNLYLFLQGKAEVNFFPGSTQKKDALTAVGQALMKKLLQLPLDKKLKIAQVLYQDLKNQNIVVNSTNTSFQSLLENQDFAGKLSSNTPDTYLLVETNLAANKSNAYVQRQTSHDILFAEGQTTHQVNLTFQNSSIESGPNPPFHYGGDYKAYLRFYLPSNAQNIKLASASGSIKPTTVQNFGFTEIGFWHTTPAQGQTSLALSYTLPVSVSDYRLTILKQHGFVSSPQTIHLNGHTTTTPLNYDFSLPRH